MAADLLTKAQIRDLITVMRDVFAYVSALRHRDPIAVYVQFPKIPPHLSESLAVHLIASQRILTSVSQPRLGGRTADVIARDNQGREIKIEVKGTGKGEWVYLTDKDYSADYLVWISFDDFFENPTQRNIRIFCLSLARLQERRQRITLQTLNQLLPGGLKPLECDLTAFL